MSFSWCPENEETYIIGHHSENSMISFGFSKSGPPRPEAMIPGCFMKRPIWKRRGWGKNLVVLGPRAVCMSLCCRIILGLSAMPATFEEVQKAYRIRAKAVHPDRPCWVIWKAMLQEMFLVDMEARDSTILIILCQLRPVTSLNIRAGRRAGDCST